MLAKASQKGARRALIAKEQGAVCPDPRSILAEVLGGVGDAHPADNRRTLRGTRSFPGVGLRPLSARA